MTTPAVPMDAKLTWIVFQGNREEIEGKVKRQAWPTSWGPGSTVTDLVLWHIPLGPKWRGELKVTGYRTPPNDNGTGTVYVSVTWTPQEKPCHTDR